VHREKIRAWNYFDPIPYVNAAFPVDRKPWSLKLHDFEVLPGLTSMGDRLKNVICSLDGDIASPTLMGQDGLQFVNQLNLRDNRALYDLDFLSRCRSALNLLRIEGCDNLVRLDGLTFLDQLRVLRYGRSHSALTRGHVDSLVRLERLELALYNPPRCEGLLQTHPQLRYLRFAVRSPVSEILDLGSNDRLEVLDLSDCKGIRNLVGVEFLPNLKRLTIDGCADIFSLASLWRCNGLEWLRLAFCSKLSDPGNLATLEALRHLELEGVQLRTLDFLSGLTNLRSLVIRNCPGVTFDTFPSGRFSRISTVRISP
jgi:hypothetical protein